ncbi:MAG: C4-dicarboxylate ABC transporter [Magnetovibrio sp.]|nr:C4-dicarboxylate ABC transporter [Magnetovibrio sp.]
MHNTVIGIIIGLVIGVVFGATIVGPRLSETLTKETIYRSNQESSQNMKSKVPQKEPITDNTVTRWKIASMFPSRVSPLGRLSKRLETLIWRTSSGQLEVIMEAPETLISAANVLNSVSSGKIVGAFGTPASWSSKIPALKLFSNVPFGPNIQEFLTWLGHGGGGKIYQNFMKKMGIHGIFCGVIAAEGGGWFRAPVKTIEGLKTLKVATEGFGASILKRIGAKTVLLSPGDIFVAFETGKIDAAEFSTPQIDATLGLHDAAKYYYFPGWQQSSTVFDLIINEKVWKTLSPSLKTSIETVCGDNIRFGVANSEGNQYAALKSLTHKGVKTLRLPREIIKAMKLSWSEVVKDESNKNAEFALTWKSLANFRKDYSIWRELSRY